MSQPFENIAMQLREKAGQLLKEKKVDLFIGYGPGTMPGRVTPLFISDPGAAAGLTWSPFCANNLAGYLLDYRDTETTVGLVVKGCDSRSVIRLIQDDQIAREKITVIGVPCAGIVDSGRLLREIPVLSQVTGFEDEGDCFTISTHQGNHRLNKKDYLLAKCLECADPGPVLWDLFAGPEPGTRPILKEKFEEIKSLEELPATEKSAFWDAYLQNCLRCYACRNVCPACNCRECIFDQDGPDWISKRNSLSENTAFHVIRALHVAGRCVDCGECDRVCPVNIPLRHLNQKILKDLGELYDTPLPGTDLEHPPALGQFSPDDPEEFK